MYRAELSASEQVSLGRCLEVLGKHPIKIAKPQDLNLQVIASRYPQLSIESFPDDYFVGVEGYNRLMLSDDFYARFASYEFILIHQLDAFVFSDQLLSWCGRNFDYIGAPWLPDKELPGSLSLMHWFLRRKMYRMIDKRHSASPFGDIHPRQFHYGVGNGGFSLRRVRSMRRILRTHDRQAELYRSAKRHAWSEDIFFSIEPNRFWHHLRIPDFRQAAHFAWELNPAAAAILTGGSLPFGCHAWNKLHRAEWQLIFSRINYSLDSLLDEGNPANVSTYDSDRAHNF